MQTDGKVAFYFTETVGNQARARVAWASPAEPFPHRLPVREDVSYWLTINDDQVVFVRHDVRRFGRRSGLTTNVGELGMVGLTGTERLLVRPVVSASFEEFFDFDGERVAWQARGCRGVLLRSKPLDELVTNSRVRPFRRASPCRLLLEERPRTRRRARFVRLPVDCSGFTRDCFLQRTTLRTLRAHKIGGRRVPAGTRVSGDTLGPALSANPRLLLTPTGRRLVRRRGGIRLGVRTTISDGPVVERRRGRITVRSPAGAGRETHSVALA